MTAYTASSESPPLLHAGAERRPYQAYCVTEASSRAQSPDNLTPLLLGSILLSAHQLDCAGQTRCPEEATPDISLIQTTASSPRHHGGHTISPKTGSKTQEQNRLPNQFSTPSNTISASPNHIARTVTPRGSHSTTLADGTVYDEALSHSRMQRPISLDTATVQQVSRKPLPWRSNHVSIDRLPLRPLLFEATRTRDLDDADLEPRYERHGKDGSKQPPKRSQTSQNLDEEGSHERFPAHDWSRMDIKRPGIEATDYPRLPSRMTTVDNVSLPNDTVPLNDYKRPNRPQRGDILDEHAQFPSSAELYISRDRPSEANDETRAYRRTEPKDAKLQYPFGRRPARFPIAPPSASSQRGVYQQSAEHNDMTPPTPSRSLESSVNTQGGPRPPPWGTYESLEMQRRQRGDFRERAQARLYRNQLDGRPLLYRGYVSTDNVGKDAMRREVEEYRELVLGLYPDLEFDDEAGTGRRACFCYPCVVM